MKTLFWLPLLLALCVAAPSMGLAGEKALQAGERQWTTVIQPEEKTFASLLQEDYADSKNSPGMNRALTRDTFPPFFGGESSPQASPQQTQPLPQTSPQQAQPFPQVPPQQQPNFDPQAQGVSPIDGIWMCVSTKNGSSLSLGFECGVYQAVINARLDADRGQFSYDGRTLTLKSMRTGKTERLSCILMGTQMQINNALFNRTGSTPGQCSGQMPQPSPQQTYPQTTPQQPYGQQERTPLEGRWGISMPQQGGVMTFIFQGNSYTCLINGQNVETGTFGLSGNRFFYATQTGKAAGKQGNYTWMLTGNTLSFTTPNGTLRFQRQ